MEVLKIKRSLNTFEVSLDDETGKLLFSGRSYPENSSGFFTPVIEWLHHYSEKPATKTECTFEIEYFNSASRKCIVEIFRILEAIHKTTGTVTIIWNFENGDDGMKETGEEYKNLFKVNFEFNAQ